MPELPEVETIVRELRPSLEWRTIVAAHVSWPRTIAAPMQDVARFCAGVRGRQVRSVGRRGKFVVLTLDVGSLLIHLRMSGRLLIVPRGPERHLRMWLELKEGGSLYFYDPRKFGRVWLLDDPDVVLGQLGPEPLADDFTAEVLADRLRGRRGMLKSLLLNQRFIAGLGNIYTDESLFRAGLHPLRAANSLTIAEVRRLHRAIREVLSEAIEHCGTTFDGAYLRPGGERGEQERHLLVYGRAGQPCIRCGTPIERITVGGRGTHICPRCQGSAG